MSNGRRVALPVRCQPVLPIEAVFRPDDSAGPLPYPLDAPGVVLTYSGTSALYQAYNALGLEPGSVVLCPSYNCGHEIEPLLRLTLRLECYRITADLAIDLQDLEEGLRRGARAVLVTHYFGFAQPLAEVRAVCDRYGALLVEDCAHTLLSDNAEHTLGRIGDIAAYSIRKSVPIPNGGAVVLNNPALHLRGELRPPPRMSTWLKAVELNAKCSLDRFTATRGPRDLLALLAVAPLVLAARAIKWVCPHTSLQCYDPDDEDLHFSTEIMRWRISAFSLRLLRRVDWSEVAQRRRDNYRLLAAGLAGVNGCRLLLPVLPENTCPLYLPVWVASPADSYKELARRRIYASVFWQQEHPGVDWAQFPEARELKRHVLVLPVHQDCRPADLERVIAAFR